MTDPARERKAAYYQANREKIRVQQRAYREKNREQLRVQQRAYYQANSEQLRSQNRERYWANREQRIARQRKYYRANRGQDHERSRQYRENNRERLAAVRMFKAHGLRPEDWAAMWEAQEGRCYLHGGELDRDTDHATHVDHDHSCCGEHRSCPLCRRGLACNDCNVAVGIVGDSPARLRQMADALEAAQREVEQRRAASVWVQPHLEDRV